VRLSSRAAWCHRPAPRRERWLPPTP